jgi:hypothetical protein
LFIRKVKSHEKEMDESEHADVSPAEAAAGYRLPSSELDDDKLVHDPDDGKATL